MPASVGWELFPEEHHSQNWVTVFLWWCKPPISFFFPLFIYFRYNGAICRQMVVCVKCSIFHRVRFHTNTCNPLCTEWHMSQTTHLASNASGLRSQGGINKSFMCQGVKQKGVRNIHGPKREWCSQSWQWWVMKQSQVVQSMMRGERYIWRNNAGEGMSCLTGCMKTSPGRKVIYIVTTH